MTAEQFVKSKNFSLDVDSVIYLCKEFSRIKCLEAIKNTRHLACDVISEAISIKSEGDYIGSCDVNKVFDILPKIQNIKNEDVLPEL